MSAGNNNRYMQYWIKINEKEARFQKFRVGDNKIYLPEKLNYY
jgi:hypothetical protein